MPDQTFSVNADQNDPASHGPASHGSASHDPASHDPASHDPASHDLASHDPASQDLASLDRASRDLAGLDLSGLDLAAVLNRRHDAGSRHDADGQEVAVDTGHHGSRDNRQAARGRSERDHARLAKGAGKSRSYAFRRS